MGKDADGVLRQGGCIERRSRALLCDVPDLPSGSANDPKRTLMTAAVRLFDPELPGRLAPARYQNALYCDRGKCSAVEDTMNLKFLFAAMPAALCI